MDKPVPQLFRDKELAAMLGISRATVWNWTKAGKLPAPVKLGPRVTAWKRADIEKWLARITACGVRWANLNRRLARLK